MGRPVELGLNAYETFAGNPEQDQEKPKTDYEQAGKERLARIGSWLKKGAVNLAVRIASVPERGRDMATALDNKLMDMHTEAGSAKDRMADIIEDTIIQGGEFVEAKYNAVKDKAIGSYRTIENRAVQAFNGYKERIAAAREARARKMQEEQYKAQHEALNRALENFNAIARATGRKEKALRPAQL